MLNYHAHRAHSPPERASPMTSQKRASRADNKGTGTVSSEEVRKSKTQVGIIYPLAIKRLLNLIEHAGELPPGNEKGVLLPAFDAGFLGDELGCRPAQAMRILEGLVLDGFLVLDGERLRVPDPGSLRTLLPLSRASPGY